MGDETVLTGCGDSEAVLLAALTWKKDWKRISALVRKWGEYALETHDTGLAARW